MTLRIPSHSSTTTTTTLQYEQRPTLIKRVLLQLPISSSHISLHQQSTGIAEGMEEELQIVAPDVAPDFVPYHFPPASAWTKTELYLLKVRFKRNIEFDPTILGEYGITSEVKKGIERGKSLLGRFKIRDLDSNKVDEDDLPESFLMTYITILDLVRAKKAPQSTMTTITEISRESSSKRVTTTSANAPPNKRAKSDHNDRTSSPVESFIVPGTPSISAASVDSTTSCDEYHTRLLMNAFVHDVRHCLKQDARTLNWCKSKVQAQLAFGTHTRTSFTLGVDSLTPANDGGFHIKLFDGKGNYDWLTHGRKQALPILSMESKRKKHSTRHNDGTLNKHTAQIFCEMLAQVCHKEFYNNPRTKYQEAFVIHATHDVFVLYYAQFSNQYLADISKYGAKHSKKSDRCVQLKRTKRYHMHHTAERVLWFELLVKLLLYLASGKAHVGYLFNYRDNPLHKLVPRGQVNDREPDPPSISSDDDSVDEGEDRMSDHDPYEDDDSVDFEEDNGSYDSKVCVSDSDWEPELEYESDSDDC